ncbi:MAG TPA: response regulator [Candidatus Veblenbacteria bacterium]|uniref:Response regulatory domain-containing protein n=5 Tax=Candidatus Vebleniibacteriota TaxID=1817921 RepID=A0A1G2Q399_9BACT|nr:MAG: PAS/PAC sensor hybrid histidine kinase [Parcubacteria group bacterium GW2011_GWA2_42_80]KKS94011.1 MAG: PAS/PAC sensor hybrid histidine kinase [Parcubacteria group bacterium GW2011_GWE2_43_12]KKT15422.1 MAG: PAS/PAC sensor hybrid histidine kinase [Parcubacteria group bacterium GW2011_GWF2_43_38]KKT17215.1 MAG: PAS/PAC sensor hybrid histidine kinase [Parcubacteria group bacterium GW2011_GWB1_43_66]KKT23224.1 MAG: PAS/PAC sensor hybrid histidine kinase [Parcubacteria group bacterium GW201
MANIEKKILIVEDEPDLLKILADKFSNEGFGVTTAGDGEEGLTAIAKDKPDVILLDIIMPRLDGMSMLKKMRQEPANKDIPVIILTNLADSDAVVSSLEHGVFDYLIKTDWQLAEVVNKVKRRLHMN